MRITDTKIKSTIDQAKLVTQNLKAHADGAHSLDVSRGKKLLTALTTLKKVTSGHDTTLTRVINQLSKAIDNAKIDPGARGLPGNGGHGPRLPPDSPIFPTGRTDPTSGTNFSKSQVDQIRLAVEMNGARDQIKNDGAFKPPVGVRYEAVTLENKMPVDGVKLTAHVAQGAVGPKQKKGLDQGTQFFLEIEFIDRRTGKTGKTWGGPFELGVAAHPMAATAQARAREYAMATGMALSRSDGVSLKAIGPERSDGKMEVTLDVHHFMDKKNVRGTVTALIEAGGGDFVRGKFTEGTTAPKPPVTGVPAKITELLTKNARSIAENLGFPMLRGHLHGPNTKIELASAKKTDAGYEVTLSSNRPEGTIHAQVDKRGALQAGWYEIGKVPAKIEKKLDDYSEIYAMASKAGEGSGHAISRSHTVDLVGITADGDGTYRAHLHVNHWRTGEEAWTVRVDLDKNGAYKAGAVQQR